MHFLVAACLWGREGDWILGPQLSSRGRFSQKNIQTYVPGTKHLKMMNFFQEKYHIVVCVTRFAVTHLYIQWFHGSKEIVLLHSALVRSHVDYCV